MLPIQVKLAPPLDPDFVPAKLWNQAYGELARETEEAREVAIAVERPDGECWIYTTQMLPYYPEFSSVSLQFAERLVKMLLWAWGGHRIRIAGAPDIAQSLAAIYSESGERSFDYHFMGDQCFRQPFRIEAAEFSELKASPPKASAEAIDLRGNRIGFDLGGSDRKCAALIDGEVVFSEEIKWSPYFESDPDYHLSGIQDSLERAASHLATVDAIGGSAAGIYINNEPRVGSLFRGIAPEDFDRHIRGIFKNLQQRWGNLPFEVANDGDVTAIAGAMAINDNAVLGISMGTSLAAGYINPLGNITGWLNELAFVPVDYRANGPIDEWSGDAGCGVQYFSQQAVGRLLPLSGIEVSDALGLPEKLEVLQKKMSEGDERATDIYRTIGIYFGYTIAHFADFYEFRHLLFLGRVSSGKGGEIIMQEARGVLDLEFPKLANKISFQVPDEQTKRHGQAIAAATLPRLD